jgi:hypothetical protein
LQEISGPDGYFCTFIDSIIAEDSYKCGNCSETNGGGRQNSSPPLSARRRRPLASIIRRVRHTMNKHASLTIEDGRGE